MQSNGFFQTTRGRILESLKRRGRRTATELADEQGLTANAIRQHLGKLEADGLIEEARARRGRTKPSLVYSVTSDGERMFPQRYDVLLNALLSEIRAEEGPERLTALFRKIGERSVRKYADRFAGKDTAGRVGELTQLLREQGVVADCERTDDGFVIREHNCPFKDTVAAHPQICTVVHTLMGEVLPGKPEQKTSIARGDAACEFHVKSAEESGESYGLS
jgi:predicted ArsR family transcriptional regulator